MMATLSNHFHVKSSAITINRRIRLSLLTYLEDLNIVDDLTLTTHTTPQHLRTTSRPKDYLEEDRSDDAESEKPITCLKERRRSSNERGVHLP